eukprot:scaffold17477_cov103-Isochrysis_galbana.AAC.4
MACIRGHPSDIILIDVDVRCLLIGSTCLQFAITATAPSALRLGLYWASADMWSAAPWSFRTHMPRPHACKRRYSLFVCSVVPAHLHLALPAAPSPLTLLLHPSSRAGSDSGRRDGTRPSGTQNTPASVACASTRPTSCCWCPAVARPSLPAQRGSRLRPRNPRPPAAPPFGLPAPAP